MIDPAFIVNSIVDDRGRVEQVFAGDWRAAHGRACEVFTSSHAQRIPEKRELVIVSCGGSPYDINMIQAHKALDMAAHACVDGGSIILLAECGDGLGRPDFRITKPGDPGWPTAIECILPGLTNSNKPS